MYQIHYGKQGKRTVLQFVLWEDMHENLANGVTFGEGVTPFDVSRLQVAADAYEAMLLSANREDDSVRSEMHRAHNALMDLATNLTRGR